MSKYFKTIGFIEFVAAAIGFVFLLIGEIGGSMLLFNFNVSGKGLIVFLQILEIILYVLFAPAVGLLFYWVGILVEERSFGGHTETSSSGYQAIRDIMDQNKNEEQDNQKIADVEEAKDSNGILNSDYVDEKNKTVIKSGTKVKILDENGLEYTVQIKIDGKIYKTKIKRFLVQKLF